MVSMQVEENSPSPQPSPTPQCVGREFVRQYYTLLAEAPRYVHRFYSNESIFVHGSDTEEIIGQVAIQNKIRDLSFEECRTRIRALDAHETLGKGVVVQVVGEISVNGGPMRRFVQTFVLAPQSEKKYYVHNDIFRYEDELFDAKLPQENGAPADPDAEKPDLDQHPQPPITNGSTRHQDEIEKSCYSLPQTTPQQVPMPVTVQTQAINQQPPTQPEVVYSGVPTSVPQGVILADTSQGAGQYWIGGDASAGVAHPSNPNASANVPQTSVAAIAPYGQQPLPPRSQQAPVLSAPSQPSLEPPSEPASQSVPVPVSEQSLPPRPQSSDKLSPVPSEEHDESADTGPADKTWANIAKQKTNRGPHPSSASQQPQQSTQIPGTSAPPMLSPATGSTAPGASQPHPDFQNRPPPLHHGQPPNRQMHQYPSARQHSFGGSGYDLRPMPGAGSHQQTFGRSGGGNRPSHANGPIDYLPNEQQAYIKNLPSDITDAALKELLEGTGFSGVVELRLRKKNGPQQGHFAFVAFDNMETAQRLIQQKSLIYHNIRIEIDVKRPMDRSGGGGSGNYSHGGPRPYPPAMSSVAGVGRGGPNMRGGMVQRGGSQNRPPGSNPGGYTSGGGGSGNRQQGSRTFHPSRGGGVQHPQ